MLRHLLLIVVFVIPFQLLSQTGIGTTTPDASAKLDVAATNKGFLPPRVSLTGISDNTTIPTPATGLLVYCKGDAGLAAGYYYWNGNAWATIATSGGSGSFAASFLRGSRSSKQTSGLTNGGTVVFNQVDNSAGQEMSLDISTGQITLAAGRTYRLLAQVPNFQTTSGETRLQLAWYNETSGSYIGSSSSSYPPGSGAAYGTTGGLSEALITTTTSTIVSYRIIQNSSANQLGGNSDFNTTGSFPWFEAQVISGNAPVTGQSVDYVQASLSANQSLSAVANINFNVSSGAGISLTSGGFNLLANKTYKLEAAIGGASGGYAYYGWVDNSNNLLPGGSIGAVIKAGNDHTDAPQDKAVVYYTPTVDTRVFLRVYNLSGTLTAYAPSLSTNFASTWASIQQVGSSAIVNPWTLSGTNTYNTTGNVGIGTSSPTEKLEVSGNVKANNFIGTASSRILYLLEASASVTYTLPGSYTNDICRYSIVNNTVNVSSSWFNTSNYRFTPQKAGYWEITASYDVYRNSESSVIIQKNGTNVAVNGTISSVVQQLTKIVYLNGSTDYITIANSGFNSNARSQTSSSSWFQAHWIGE
jgi:hypothetical protein